MPVPELGRKVTSKSQVRSSSGSSKLTHSWASEGARPLCPGIALMMAGMSTVGDDLEPDGIRPVVTVTEAARSPVARVLSRETDAASLALWIEVSGERDGAYAYDMYFQAVGDA